MAPHTVEITLKEGLPTLREGLTPSRFAAPVAERQGLARVDVLREGRFIPYSGSGRILP